jgi:hypothetical protein
MLKVDFKVPPNSRVLFINHIHKCLLMLDNEHGRGVADPLSLGAITLARGAAYVHQAPTSPRV